MGTINILFQCFSLLYYVYYVYFILIKGVKANQNLAKLLNVKCKKRFGESKSFSIQQDDMNENKKLSKI